MTQKDAVFSAVTTVLLNNNLPFQSGITNVSELINKTLRSQVAAILVAAFANGDVELSDEAKNKLADESALRLYVSGLISNWLRKDPRLNGGSVLASTTSKPSKITRNDPQLQALRKLLSTEVDTDRRAEIQGFLDRRISELTGNST